MIAFLRILCFCVLGWPPIQTRLAPPSCCRSSRGLWVAHCRRWHGATYRSWTRIDMTPSVGLSREYFVGD